MANNDNSSPIIPGSSHLNEVPNPEDTKKDWQPLDASNPSTPGSKPVNWGQVMADNNPGALPPTGNTGSDWGNMDNSNLAQAEEIPAPTTATPIAAVPLASTINPNLDSPVSAPLADIAPQPVIPPPGIVEPPKALPKAKAKRKAPIALYLILFLLVVILGLTSLVIYLLTGGAATVNLTAPNNSSSTSSVTTSTESSSVTSSASATSVEPTAQDITFYLVAYGSDNIGGVVDETTLPQGSVKFGQEDYLVPFAYKQNLTTNNPVEEALKGLFAIKAATYGDKGYKTTTYLSDIQPKVTRLSDGTTQVNLVGNVVLAGDLSGLYFQAQVEQTVKKYSNKYVIQLNGSEQEFKCINDLSGLCGSSSSSSKTSS
jgi:cytoskeletal protein RodZ